MEPEDLLRTYEELINRHDFDLLVPLIAADASFWFSEGSYVGLAAIRAAFERTWAELADETYWLDDRHWLARDTDVAACTYRFNWTAMARAKSISGRGRGTTIVRRSADGWRIVHEHLSPMPQEA